MPPKRYSQRPKLKKQPRALKKRGATPKKSDASPLRNVEALRRELTEALEQQTATSEILRVIASSPTDLQPVLDVVAENAARLCEATDAMIHRIDGDKLRTVANYGPLPGRRGEGLPSMDRRSIPGRTVIDRRTIHIHDLAAEPEDDLSAPFARSLGVRTVLATPLLREGLPIGAILIRRLEVRPFTDKQIELLKTFADQAVIAIENVRLFNEIKEALEQQTATSEILRVIASSPTDIQPVLDAVAENAARLCEAEGAQIRLVDGDVLRLAAKFGAVPGVDSSLPLSRGFPGGRAILNKQTIHVHDLAAELETEYPDARQPQQLTGTRTALNVPLLREGVGIGCIVIRRTEVRPFSDKQIKLLETFADQAVIAIENVRLFNETKEALEQQTATSEVLKVISRSAFDVTPVFQAVVQNAVDLCGADNASILRREGDIFRYVANAGEFPDEASFMSYWGTITLRPGRGSLTGRVALERRSVQIDDIDTDPEYEREFATHKLPGSKTHLGVPLLKDGEPIGLIIARRFTVRPFTEKQIKLLETFADQAVIAIENVRLFQELQARNRDLTEALEQQTATSEILRVISSSPTNLQPVFDTILANATRLCEANLAALFLYDGEVLTAAAHHNASPSFAEHLKQLRARPSRDTVVRLAALEREVVHVADVLTDPRFSPASLPLYQKEGARTILAVPMLRENVLVGAILIWRTEVRPFTEKQIALLKTFADQAVIAIENVRLFQELKEALEQQTATSEILGVIASSPTDIQPVLDTVAENAARLCDAKDAVIFRIDGDVYQRVAHYGSIAALDVTIRRQITRGTPAGRAIVDRQTVHIQDLAAEVDNEFPDSKVIQQLSRTRTILATPLLREGIPIGAIYVRRTEVRPFSDKQVKLLETFADQAVIAIENVRLFKELQDRNRQLTEALEQQTATSEILRVIASSPTDVQPVLNVVAENAARLCDAKDASIFRADGDILQRVAVYGPMPVAEMQRPITPGTPLGRAMTDRKTIHVHDLAAELETGFPESKPLQQRTGARTVLATPLLREGVPIGAIWIRRTEVRPFSEKQIALLKTFADQAVIAIENVRLFQELEERNAELREALEHQTATAEVLGIISRSPTDVQPVLDAIVASAARVCGIDDVLLRLREGNAVVPRAHFGSIPIGRVEISIDEPQYRWMREHGALHVPDVRAQNDFPMMGSLGNFRTILAVPLRQQGELIGGLYARRIEVRPFTPAQIKLLETFADQAVIAIENVRLFQELTEALEQQTATSEILGVIARSPTDIQPVLNTIAENAARVCGATDATVFMQADHALYRKVAGYGPVPGSPIGTEYPLNRDTAQGRAIVDREAIHIHDLLEVAEDFPDARTLQMGYRTMLAAPLLREGVPIGAIGIRRLEVRPFTDKQIALLKTFADQAVIAIENVRLFQELTEALERQTATSQILGVIASSPTDIQPVLDVVAENAARLCDSTDSQIYRVDDGMLQRVAVHGSMPLAGMRRPLTRGTPTGRAIVDRKVIHVRDITTELETEYPESKSRQQVTGSRTILVAPLLREGISIGAILIRRNEVRPFTEKQITLLKTFADQAVIAIENVRLFQELEARTSELARSVEELKALGEVGQAVSSTLDLQTVLSTIVGRAVQLSGTDGGAIYEYDEESQEFLLRASQRIEQELVEALRASPIRLGTGAIGQAAASRAPVQVTDVMDERQYSATRRPMLLRLGYRSLLAVPLLREDRIMGGLTIYRRKTGSFSTEVVNLLQTFATQSVLAIQNARLFREIEDKSHQIEAANRHKSEFLANMSHELRTPLNAIIGFSEVLSEKMFGELNEKQAEYTEDILSSGRHLLSLINDILDLAKVEAGRMDLELTKFDLPLAVENALTLMRERATRQGISLSRTVDEHLGDFVADERKVKQVLLNLLSNAVKFTPEGGRIEVKAVRADGSVEISVIDTGIGIASKDQETIFEEFRQVGADYSHKREGTGLGLTLTRKFVEMHGGRIWVESEPGKGATFTFTLPIRPWPES